MESRAESKLPVVEFAEANLTPGTTSWKSTSDSVRRALETYGCVVVSYEKTGLEQLQQSLFSLWEELFGLPMETKMKHTSELAGFGYGGNYPNMPQFESFGIKDGGTHEAVKDFTTLMWPHGNDKFCESVYSYNKLLLELDHTVMEMVMSSYGLEKYYKTLTESSLYMTRLIKYHSTDKNKNNVGLMAHRDKSFISIICANEVKGLQIETPNGEWIDFQPSPSKFIVIVGEAFKAWSNGRVYCPLHRVIAREFKERYSIGIFSFIREILQIPEEFVDHQYPLKFKSFNNLEFLEYCKKEGRSTLKSAIQTYCGIN